MTLPVRGAMAREEGWIGIVAGLAAVAGKFGKRWDLIEVSATGLAVFRRF
jgi:hypothetical protein